MIMALALFRRNPLRKRYQLIERCTPALVKSHRRVFLGRRRVSVNSQCSVAGADRMGFECDDGRKNEWELPFGFGSVRAKSGCQRASPHEFPALHNLEHASAAWKLFSLRRSHHRVEVSTWT